MKNFLAQIQKEVPLVIFDVPQIKEKSMKLFDENEKQIKERFNEIVTYLNMNDQISYKDVLELFQIIFLSIYFK